MIALLTSGPVSLVALDVARDNSTAPTSIITYGRFLEYIDNGWVKKVDFYNNSKFVVIEAATPTSGYRLQRIGVNIPNKDTKLVRKLKDSSINFDVHAIEESTPPFEINFSTVSIFFGSLLGLYFIVNRLFFNTELNPFGFQDFFQTRPKYESVRITDITFEDVAGVEEIKEEFKEIVSFLQNPDRFTRIGAEIPKGVLLFGPPGTGKTLLAKAIAGEAMVPFFSCAAGEFIELYVGIGASRIRELFKEAKLKTPCIIFIDEIDAVARRRGSGIGGGNDEREQTLNQLLTELDGFKPNNGIVVVAATNRVDILDTALLRPGRFDRQLAVGFPDAKARLSILKVHAKDKKLDKDVQLQTVANRTPGFSGADLANVLNEAAILAARANEESITRERINEALDKTIAGIAGLSIEENRFKRSLAYHEVGHALTASLLKYHDPVGMVSLIPQGRYRSFTTYLPTDESMYSRNQLLARLVSLLAGRATEEVVFGKGEVTTLAYDDIQRASSIARQIVTQFGMSSIGPISFRDNQPRDVMMRVYGPTYSPSFANTIDKTVKLHLLHAYSEAILIIKENRSLLDKLVSQIIEKETLEGFEVRRLLAEERLSANKIKYDFNFPKAFLQNEYYRKKLKKLKQEKVVEKKLIKKKVNKINVIPLGRNFRNLIRQFLK